MLEITKSASSSSHRIQGGSIASACDGPNAVGEADSVRFSPRLRTKHLSGEVRIVQPKPNSWTIPEGHPYIQDFHQPWSVERYNIVREPIVIGAITDQARFSQRLPFADYELTLKLFGGDYELPIELNQFGEAVEKIISAIHNYDPLAWEYAAYLTVNQSVVTPGQSQRTGLIHPEGMNRKSFKGFSVVADRDSTIFSRQTFQITKDYATFYNQIEAQASEENNWQADPYVAIFAGPYDLHFSPCNGKLESAIRTFLRITYKAP